MRPVPTEGTEPYTDAVHPAPFGGHRPTFTFLGFPTTVRPGFLVFSALLAVLYPFPLGLWIAAAMAVFTLLHEFGHAWMARRAGCIAAISLDFMVAYASYRPRRPLSWSQRAAIALAGPLVQVGTAMVVLLATGTNPFDRASIVRTDLGVSVWWAGVALGVLNLVPLLPLDGGAIVASIVDSFAPETGRVWVLRASMVVTAAIAAVAIMYDYTGLVPLLVFMLVVQYQTLVAPARLHQLLVTRHLDPIGDPDVDAIIADALIEDGHADHAGQFAAAAYRACPSASLAVAAARAALRDGRPDDAVAWLWVADRSSIDPHDVQFAMARSEDFTALRGRPDASAKWFAEE